MDSYTAISNLVYIYAQKVDAGDFAAVGELFADAEVVTSVGTVRGRADVTAHFTRISRIYDDGTPKTKHITTNLIIDVDGDTAKAYSNFLVYQEVPVGSRKPQVIVAGRYEDRFRRVNDKWRFERRQMFRDLVGDTSAHMAI